MFFYTGLFQTFQSLEHQLLFSAFLQFPNYQFSSTIDTLNSLAAVFGLLLPASLIFFSVSQANIQNRNRLYWGYIFQGVKPNYWAILQKPLQLIKVTLYIGTIVGFSEYSVAQSYLLSFISAIYCSYLLNFRPFESTLENIKLIIREILFLSVTGTFLAYSYQLTEFQCNVLGWVQIGLFSSIMGSNLLIDLTKQVQNFYQQYQKSVRKELEGKRKPEHQIFV